nr:immunoglobulin light chain junction region [Macaca mulatta]
CQQYYTDPRTF